MLTLLDAPKAPMDPAWVSVLRISCSWARGYHQIVLIEIEGNRVWDGNFIFKDPLAIPSDMVRENPPPSGVEFGSRAHWEAEGCGTYFCKLIDFNSPYTDPNYRWETNHPNTKLNPPKLKVTTADWQNDGCF